MKKLRIDEAYKRTFGSDPGTRVLTDLLTKYHCLDTTYRPDPTQTSFLEGQRSVVLSILKIVKQDTARLEKHLEEMERNYDDYSIV